MDLRNPNVQSPTEVFGCIKDREILGFRPEVKLIAIVMTRMAVILMRGDIDDEGAWIVAALQWTETA